VSLLRATDEEQRQFLVAESNESSLKKNSEDQGESPHHGAFLKNIYKRHCVWSICNAQRGGFGSTWSLAGMGKGQSKRRRVAAQLKSKAEKYVRCTGMCSRAVAITSPLSPT